VNVTVIHRRRDRWLAFTLGGALTLLVLTIAF
jgi:hypothetical protein